MRLYDISVGISPSLPIWPGDPQVRLEQIKSIQAGDTANVTHMSCSVHTGTHIDAPAHFLADAGLVSDIPLKTLIGRTYVVHVPQVDIITASVLEHCGLPARTRRVLFRTRNSRYWEQSLTEFQKDFVALDSSAAAWLVGKGIQLVGVDYLSVAPFKKSVETHQILLQAGVVIVEGLDLSAVAAGRYTLFCLPLKIEGVEGAPARAILQER